MYVPWKEILKAEKDIVQCKRLEGKEAFRLSTVGVCVLAFLYLLTDIDLISEKFVQPLVFAYLDDLIVFIYAVVVAYRDLEEVVIHHEVRPTEISEVETARPSESPSDFEPGEGLIDSDAPSVRYDIGEWVKERANLSGTDVSVVFDIPVSGASRFERGIDADRGEPRVAGISSRDTEDDDTPPRAIESLRDFFD